MPANLVFSILEDAHARAHAHPNDLSAAEIYTGWKMPHFDKPLEAVTSAAVTNWKRQKEELIRSDFLSRARVLSTSCAVQSEWSMLGINDTETHKNSAQCSIKTESVFKSEAGLQGVVSEIPPSPLFLIIINTSHFQLHLQPVLCRVGLLNQTMPGFIVSLHILHFDSIFKHFPPLSSPTPTLQSMTVVQSLTEKSQLVLHISVHTFVHYRHVFVTLYECRGFYFFCPGSTVIT